MPLARTDTSPLFGAGATSTLRLVVYLALGVTLMVADFRGHYLKRVREFTAVAIEPVYRIAAMPADAARAVRLAVADRQALTQENQRLREALLLTQARLNRLGAVAEQNTRLKELLEVQHSLGLGVPFLIAALAINQFFAAFAKIRKHYHAIEVGSGLLLCAIGILIFTDRFTIIARWLSPYLPTL
jgi:cytochrome c biogenesis protein CcdA